MPNLETELDIQFFEMIYHLLENQPEEDDSDPFARYVSRTCQIAPFLSDTKLPAPGEMSEVNCNELTQNYMSFFADEPPESNQLVVQLGKHGNQLFVHSEIEQTERVVVLPSGSMRHLQPDESFSSDNSATRSKFLMKCRFVKRIESMSKGKPEAEPETEPDAEQAESATSQQLNPAPIPVSVATNATNESGTPA